LQKNLNNPKREDDIVEELIKEFQQKKNEFQNEPDKKKKDDLKDEVEDLMIKIFERQLQKKYAELKSIKEKARNIPNKKAREEYIKAEKTLVSKRLGFDLENIEKQLREFTSKNQTKPFFPWKLYFAEVFEKKNGFDVVIANPPYVRVSGISEEEDKTIRNKYRAVFGHYDLYIPFIERGIFLLNNKGVMAYITPNKYLTKRYANKLRPFLLKETSLIQLIDTSQAKTFDTASVYPVITILTKRETDKKIKIAILDDFTFWPFFNSGLRSNGYYLDQKEFENNKNHIFDIFIDSGSRSLFRKISNDSKVLGSYSRILTGTPAINKFYEWDKLLVSEEEARKSKAEKLKFINVSNVKPYFISWGEKIRAVKKTLTNPYLIFDENLVGKNKWSVFKKKKIVIKGTAKNLTAAYDQIGYANLSLYAIIFDERHNDENKTLYHLGLLNSKLLNYWYCKKFASSNLAGNYISFNGIYLEQLPIKQASQAKQKSIISLVKKILTITKSNNYLQSDSKQKEVQEYKKKIDRMVFELYGLDNDEIKLIKEHDQENK